MTWTVQKWVNLRATVASVTDGSGQTHIADDDAANGAYPSSRTLDGDTFNCGWIDLPQARDRDVSADPRLAGMGFFANTGTPGFFEWDVPAGSTQVRLAFGDADNDRSYMEWSVYNDSTLLETIVCATNTPAGQWRDAAGTLRTSNADWIANNAAKTYNITSGKLKIAVGSLAAQTDVTCLATIGVLQPGAISKALLSMRNNQAGF